MEVCLIRRMISALLDFSGREAFASLLILPPLLLILLKLVLVRKGDSLFKARAAFEL